MTTPTIGNLFHPTHPPVGPGARGAVVARPGGHSDGTARAVARTSARAKHGRGAT